jgi:hypothetical protein
MVCAKRRESSTAIRYCRIETVAYSFFASFGCIEPPSWLKREIVAHPIKVEPSDALKRLRSLG